MKNSAHISALYRHPVKGLSAERIPEAELTEGGYFPDDRIYAIENGPSGFNPKAAEHMPKQRFIMLMRNERLAKLGVGFDPKMHRLSIRQGGAIVAEGSLDTEDGRAGLERFLSNFMGEEMRGPPRILKAPPNFAFTDSRSGFVSLINLASVAAIAQACGRNAIDPLRFRGNLHITGWQAWQEAGLQAGTRLIAGEAELAVIKPIERCAAVDVDPQLGLRDLTLVKTLERVFGHHDCGIYARVVKSGTIRQGDAIVIAPTV